MGSCVMDAMEGRKVITVDIPGAFLQSDWPQDVYPCYIMFKGIMVGMICEIDQTYIDKIIWSKDQKKKFYTVNSLRLYTNITWSYHLLYKAIQTLN